MRVYLGPVCRLRQWANRRYFTSLCSHSSVPQSLSSRRPVLPSNGCRGRDARECQESEVIGRRGTEQADCHQGTYLDTYVPRPYYKNILSWLLVRLS